MFRNDDGTDAIGRPFNVERANDDASPGPWLIHSPDDDEGQYRCSYCGSQCWQTLAAVPLDAWTLLIVETMTCEGCDSLPS